ncbi:hypothetical protein BH11PSE12_BH11PSE12_30790 [soil metagenome]
MVTPDFGWESLNTPMTLLHNIYQIVSVDFSALALWSRVEL